MCFNRLFGRKKKSQGLLINEHKDQEETSEIITSIPSIREEKTSSTSFLINFQLLYTTLNMFVDTGYTIGVIVTDSLNWEADFYGISYWSLLPAVPLALYFSYCEGLCHTAQSVHYDRIEPIFDLEQPTLEKRDEPIHPGTTLTDLTGEVKSGMGSLTRQQKLLAAGHYLADVFGDANKKLFILKMANIDQVAHWQRGLAYLAMGLYSLLGNAQELSNTIVAFKSNNKEEEKHPSPRSRR